MCIHVVQEVPQDRMGLETAELLTRTCPILCVASGGPGWEGRAWHAVGTVPPVRQFMDQPTQGLRV